MTRIHSINKVLICKTICYEEVCDNAKNTTYFHSNNSIIFTTQFHSAYGSIMPGRYFSSGTGYRYGFNGIEKADEISGAGNHYTALFGEEDPRIGRRWNQDPKPNPSIFNYAMFANNPIWFSDILLDSIKITGTLADDGFKQLQQASSLTLTRNSETGLLSAKQNFVGPLTEYDQTLLDGINDTKIMVDVQTTDKNRVSEGGNLFMSGAFMGSVQNADGTVNATQVVNPNHMTIKEEFIGGAKGITFMHETIEAYIGAKNYPGAKPNSSEYEKAHNAANSADPRRNIPWSYPNEIKNFNKVTGKGDVYIYVQKASGEAHLLYLEKDVQLAKPEPEEPKK